MALISVPEVKAASPRVENFSHQYSRKSASAVLEEQRRTAPANSTFDIFLSHSYRDAKLILALRTFLENFDLSVYIDWVEDAQMDRSKVTPSTANTLRRRMNQCRCLLFATTTNTGESVWMPWELGYFDGKKNGRAAIIPLTPSKVYGNTFRGQEYLGLYPYIVREHDTNGVDKLWVHTDEKTYVSLGGWLQGKEPFRRG